MSTIASWAQAEALFHSMTAASLSNSDYTLSVSEDQGGSNANAADLEILDPNGKLLKFEIKQLPSQSGQVAFRETTEGLSLVAPSTLPSVHALLDKANEALRTGRASNTTILFSDYTEEEAGQFILEHYGAKGVLGFMLNHSRTGQHLVIPRDELLDHVVPSMTIRRKGSGSSHVSKKNIPAVIEYVSTHHPSAVLTVINGKVSISGPGDMPKEFSVPTSSGDIRIVQGTSPVNGVPQPFLRQGSFTKNPTLVASLTPREKSFPERDFSRDLKALLSTAV